MNKPHSARLVFLDLMRGWAVLLMMEAHVCDALLQPSVKATRWFGYFTFSMAGSPFVSIRLRVGFRGRM